MKEDGGGTGAAALAFTKSVGSQTRGVHKIEGRSLRPEATEGGGLNVIGQSQHLR